MSQRWAIKAFWGLALISIACCPLPARAEIATTAFDAANKLYEEGKFATAASAYEELVRSGRVSAALYFNLGNAFFKSGRIGCAIAAYRQAEQIAPRDPDLRANLQFARNQTQGPALSASRWQHWLGKLTLNEWTLVAASAVWLWFFLLALLEWRPAFRRILNGYMLALAVAAAASCLCLAAALYNSHYVRTVIVIAPEAVVRYGPLEESQSAFTVHDGFELRVLDQKDDWLQVSVDARRTGWLRKDQTLFAPRG